MAYLQCYDRLLFLACSIHLYTLSEQVARATGSQLSTEPIIQLASHASGNPMSIPFQRARAFG
jgi:hypothetical protein